MSELKCPFCQQELKCIGEELISPADTFYCPNCRDAIFMQGNERIWQELITTRKALDVAVDALKNIGDRYDEEIARSADEDDCADWFICSQDVMLLVEQALDQITALEQKDIK